MPASLDLLFREMRCTRRRGSRSTPNLQRESRARPVDLAGRRFRAQPMRTAAPPRGLTAEHLAFNLPRAKRARLFMIARNGSPRISRRGSLAHQFEMLATSVRRCGPPPDFARNGKAQMRRAFFAFGLLGIRMTDQVVNFIGQREGNRGLSYAG